MITINNTRTHAQQLIDAFRTSGATPVLDLDGVLLNANHRIKLHEDGSLDLDHYRSNTTAEQVAQDKNLPLIEFVAWLNERRLPYYVATARVLCEHSQKLLADRNIRPIYAMAREGDNDHRKDYKLKCDWFMRLFTGRELPNLVLIDDCLANCKAAIELGMKAIHVDAPEVLA